MPKRLWFEVSATAGSATAGSSQDRPTGPETDEQTETSQRITWSETERRTWPRRERTSWSETERTWAETERTWTRPERTWSKTEWTRPEAEQTWSKTEWRPEAEWTWSKSEWTWPKTEWTWATTEWTWPKTERTWWEAENRTWLERTYHQAPDEPRDEPPFVLGDEELRSWNVQVHESSNQERLDDVTLPVHVETAVGEAAASAAAWADRGWVQWDRHGVSTE
jgi:hypothetical protein